MADPEITPAAPATDTNARRRELEAEFCAMFTEKARLEEQGRLAHDQLMRLQGRLEELRRMESP